MPVGAAGLARVAGGAGRGPRTDSGVTNGTAFTAAMTRKSAGNRFPAWADTDSVCFVDNPGQHRVANFTSGTRFGSYSLHSD
ncbi:hypothetical protein DEGR_06970 [Deinococcus grandis]|nr:hypothetical protein DEGR_06970 [Deinococcus grandis]